MSITVEECMECIALRDAELLAGSSGKQRIVSSVSVIEYPDVALLTGDLVVGNELMLSALVHIKDDVDKQCLLIRHLHSMGAAGLVLYYVGTFLPEVHPRLRETADEISFPLIAMPTGRMDYRYSDVITSVMQILLMKQKEEVLSDITNQMSMLAPQHRTIPSVLRLLSDRLQCSLILTDRYLKRRSAAAWPLSNKQDYESILEQIQRANLTRNHSARLRIGENETQVWCIAVEAKEFHGLKLFVLDEEGKVSRNILQQASEVISTYLNIWDNGLYREGTDALVQAVLSDNPAEMLRLASRLRIQTEVIHTLWFLKLPERLREQDTVISSVMFKLKTYLGEYHKVLVVDHYEDYIVAFCDNPILPSNEKEKGAAFCQQLTDEGIPIRGAVFEDVQNTTQARAAYVEMCDSFALVGTIYARKLFFTRAEFRFARCCRSCLASGESGVEAALEPLKKLRQLPDAEDLLETLTTFLLDADSNSQQTGSYLFLHKNTVNYRLNKIRDALNCNLFSLPGTMDVYRAAAMIRILKPSKIEHAEQD